MSTKKELREKIEKVLADKGKLGMHAIGRALVHLKNRQTEEERITLSTRVHNNRGFMPQHAEIGVNMAHFYEENGFISTKQMKYWQSGTEKNPKPRIIRYWKQLVEEAEKKQQVRKV